MKTLSYCRGQRLPYASRMAEEKKRGRPRGTTRMVTLYTRLPEEEAASFEALVKRRSLAATGTEDALTTASVLRGLVKAAVEADASAPAPPVERTPKPSKRAPKK
jgi:hypothetical protein